MKIIDAKWETPEESNRRISFFKTFNRKEESIKWCNEHYKELIEWHNEFSIAYPKMLYEKELEQREQRIIDVNNNNAIFEKIKNGEKYHCICGGKVRYIPSYNFCGCDNYRDKSYSHTTYNIMHYCVDTPIVIEIGKNYLNHFKKKYAISAMSSIVYKTLKAHGVQMLNDEIDEQYFNTVRNSSFESKTEEAMILSILKDKFDKVCYQQGIKISDGKKWSTIIPDYICINDDSIQVFDAKKSISGLDRIQLATYHYAIEVIAKKSNMPQEVKSYTIIYEPQEFSDSELLLKDCYNISMLQNI
jgi:hypothetical protein